MSGPIECTRLDGEARGHSLRKLARLSRKHCLSSNIKTARVKTEPVMQLSGIESPLKEMEQVATWLESRK